MYKSLLLVVFATALGASAEVRAADVQGSAALTSDYVFRGISQTAGDPALQAGLRWQNKDGFYVSSWASTLKPYPDNGADAELDLTAGWNGSLGHDVTLDANVVRYIYPGANRSTSDYNELGGTLTWRQRFWVQAGWSDDVFASGKSALYVQLGGRLPLIHGFSLEAALGRYDLNQALGRSYQHEWVALAYTAHACTFRLALHDTDHAARTLFPRLAGSHVELSIAVAF